MGDAVCYRGIQRDDREVENEFDSKSEEEISYYDCLTPATCNRGKIFLDKAPFLS